MDRKKRRVTGDDIGLVIYEINLGTIANPTKKFSRNNLRILTGLCFARRIKQVMLSTLATLELTNQMTRLSIRNSFEYIVSPVRNRPAVIRAALVTFNVEENAVRYIGDSPQALCEAKMVGIPTIGLANTHQAIDLVASANPDAIAHDFEEIFDALDLR